MEETYLSILQRGLAFLNKDLESIDKAMTALPGSEFETVKEGIATQRNDKLADIKDLTQLIERYKGRHSTPQVSQSLEDIVLARENQWEGMKPSNAMQAFLSNQHERRPFPAQLITEELRKGGVIMVQKRSRLHKNEPRILTIRDVRLTAQNSNRLQYDKDNDTVTLIEPAGNAFQAGA